MASSSAVIFAVDRLTKRVAIRGHRTTGRLRLLPGTELCRSRRSGNGGSVVGYVRLVSLITSSPDAAHWQRWRGDAIQALQDQDRELRPLQAEIRVGRLELFVSRMPVAALAVAAGSDGGNARRHRLVGIGA